MASNQNPYGVSPNNETANKQTQFAPVKNNGHAIAALILGILSLFMSIFTAIPGVILGHMALSKIKHKPEQYEGSGMAIAGLIMSYLFLILGLIMIGFVTYMVMYVPEFKEEFYA